MSSRFIKIIEDNFRFSNSAETSSGSNYNRRQKKHTPNMNKYKNGLEKSINLLKNNNRARQLTKAV